MKEYGNLKDPTPTLFAKVAFGWEAFDYQVSPVDNTNKRVLIASGRQVGKTEMAAILGLYHAVMNPNNIVLIISPTQRQSGILFRKMKYFLNKNSQMPEELRIPVTEFIRRETQTVLEFDNGSEIHSLPASEDGSNIRGFTAHMIIIDEAGFIDDRVYKAIRPMLATTKGKLMLIGSPNGVGNRFYKFWKEGEFSTYHFPSIISPLITEKFLEDEKKTMSEVEFRQEYGGEFVESYGVMFPREEVETVSQEYPFRDKPLMNQQYILGFDPARSGNDEAVGLVLERRHPHADINPLRTMPTFKVVAIYPFKGKKITEQAEIIKGLHEIWNFKKIIIDATGLGAGLVDQLEGFPIEPFTFTIKSKMDIYGNLKMLIETKDIILPKRSILTKQLCDLKTDDSRADGLTKITHPSGGHDDYATALALAAWNIKKKPQPILFDTGKGFFN